MTVYYKILNVDGTAHYGGVGSWPLPARNDDGTWQPGDWTPVVPDPQPCVRGWHIVTLHQLIDWLGPAIWTCEPHPDATVIDDGDKHVCSQARLLAPTGWDKRTARLFAADCAEHVLHLFEDAHPDDDRPRAAIAAARRYANGDIDRHKLADAADAAWSVARAAARVAVRAAADAADAAWSAARAAADAADAAWSAAGVAARVAAWDAARVARAAAGVAAGAAAEDAAYAAGDAEREWQTQRLHHHLTTGDQR